MRLLKKKTGGNLYVHKMFKSGDNELWWGLEMDSPYTWQLRQDLGLKSENNVPHKSAWLPPILQA